MQSAYVFPSAQSYFPPTQGYFPPTQGYFPPAHGYFPPTHGYFPPTQGYYQASHTDLPPGSWFNGVGAAGNNVGSYPSHATDPWDAFPEIYRPTLASFGPFVLHEHDRAIASLLSAAPDKFMYPPIPIMATPRKDELKIRYDICIQIVAYPPEARKAIITFAEPIEFTLDHLFLALTIFRQPPNIDDAVRNLADLVKAMVERFRKWAISWNADVPREECENPEQVAAELKAQGYKVLLRQYPFTDETKWLHAMLRALGDIPEVWGFPGTPPPAPAPTSNSGETPHAASQDAQGVPLQEQDGERLDPMLVSDEESNHTNAFRAPPALDPSFPGGHTLGIASGVSQSRPSGYDTLPASLPPRAPNDSQFQFIYYGPNSAAPTTSAAPAQGAPTPVAPLSSNAHPSATTSGPTQPAPSGQLPAAGQVQQGPSAIPSDAAARLGQHREANGSRQSLVSSSSRGSKTKARVSLSSTQKKISKLSEILQVERERILHMEQNRDIAQSLSSHFYRGLFTEYSHYFTESRLCQAYRAAILRAPNAMISIVTRICEHMQTDVDILCELGKV